MSRAAVLSEVHSQLQRGKRPAPPPWQPPLVGTFRNRMPVRAWDATLGHCGWVIIERVDREVLVRDKGTIHIDTELTSYLGTWERARLLRAEVRELMDSYPCLPDVVESPAVRGHRLESSLIAGMTIWLETVSPSGTGAAQVSRTHVFAVLTGNPRLKSAEGKKAVKAAVARYVPESATRKWDEHQRDALAAALTYLHDQNRAQDLRGLLANRT